MRARWSPFHPGTPAPAGTAARRAWFGLNRTRTVYHHPLRDRRATASVRALRCQTSDYRFPDLGRLATHRARRTSLPLGLPRADRG